MPPPSLASLGDALLDARALLEAALPGRGVDARPVAIGWATVETERAEAELCLALGAALGPFGDVPNDTLLGARCRLGAGGPAGALVIIEPATEGRLAESLARRGEGPLAVWFSLASAPAEGMSAPADGPFGPERVVLGGQRDGRRLLVVERAPGTIPT